MIKKILATTLLLVMTLLPVNVYAAVTPVGGGGAATVDGTSSVGGKQDACEALKQLDPAKACGGGSAGVSGIIKTVINILSLVAGFLGVIFVIISGFKYITSGGDSAGISSAKSTLVYALVGLAVAASAQVLVRFVLYNVQ